MPHSNLLASANIAIGQQRLAGFLYSILGVMLYKMATLLHKLNSSSLWGTMHWLPAIAYH